MMMRHETTRSMGTVGTTPSHGTKELEGVSVRDKSALVTHHHVSCVLRLERSHSWEKDETISPSAFSLLLSENTAGPGLCIQTRSHNQTAHIAKRPHTRTKHLSTTNTAGNLEERRER